MFDIPELNDLICWQLELDDLARCARVNKKWHKCAIPYLWYEFTFSEDSLSTEKAAFCKLVAEDFLHQRWEQQSQKIKEDLDQDIQPPSSPFLSSLSKHGRWIRRTSGPGELLSCLDLLSHVYARRLELSIIDPFEYPSPDELLRHFYKCCRTIQVDYVRLMPEDFRSGLCKMITEEVVLHVRHLHIEDFASRFKIHPSDLKCLLDRLSTTLEVLTLRVNVSSTEDERREKGTKAWTSFRELNLLERHGASYTGPFWSWLWARCAHAERLEVGSINEAETQSLADAIWTHMPNLHTIQVKWNKSGSHNLTDKQIATLLSCSRNGWRVVIMSNNLNFGNAALRVLTLHYSTLVELLVDGCNGFTGKDLAQVLSSCPNLRILVAIDDEIYSEDVEFISIDAGMFIDQDPSTGILKTWPCESSLELLAIKISNIPRPDVKRASASAEAYPGQGREIQNLVYERLARLASLQILWLGHCPEFIDDRPRYGHQVLQHDCLEMSLESGLEKLAGLKEMRALSVARMERRNGYDDILWMAKNWPKLLMIAGLDDRIGDMVAMEWLNRQYPWIILPIFQEESNGGSDNYSNYGYSYGYDYYGYSYGCDYDDIDRDWSHYN
ncbi:hypothetical protein B0O80DRAFT_448479 [Mortierella sp. GBAus27b]|nr:hypothetical protein BGX31_011026 [Mortierella sp. GBA43]KAI8355998.1 hypothetical protein B0O80DRAFT_448479 [Mortierella sp. GBAus27b]